MANLALLTQHGFNECSSSLVAQREVSCRRPEVENAVDVCDEVGLFRSTLLADGVASTVLSRRSDETGSVSSRTGTCSPSLSLKHFRSSSSVDPITPDELASRMVADSGNGSDVTGRPVVMVDCRTFLAFNTNHVTGAFNASCGDRFSKKRLMQGRATVADLISGGPSREEAGGAREAYRRLAEATASSPAGLFVAYDDNTNDLDVLQESHPLRLLTTSLTGSGYHTKYLAGGMQAFYALYSSFCSKPDDPPSRPFLYSPTTPVVELDVDSAEMSQILPFLYLGNERDAANRQLLKDAGINHVLNVTSHVPLHFSDDVTMTYRRIPASDSGCQNLKQFFNEIVAFIESARCSGGKVLVHCQAGVSRSPTLVVAYLIARYGHPLMETFQLVKQRRQIIAPNFNFLGQLLEFEQRCRRGELRESINDSVPPPPFTENTPV